MPTRSLFATVACLSFIACAHNNGVAEQSGPRLIASNQTASADVLGAEGTSIGTLDLKQGPHGTLIRVSLNPGALSPGWHGLHLHQIGDCSDTGTYKLSGGHVGKIEGGHGLLNPGGPEAGDTPNIHAAADGSAAMEIITARTTLAELTDADGSALIIHAGEDDHITQPIGGAGARVACAVIGG